MLYLRLGADTVMSHVCRADIAARRLDLDATNTCVSMPNTNFTAKGLAALKPAAVRIDYWDESLPGFGLRGTPDRQKTSTVRYRSGGRKRRYTLGVYPALSLADARKLAREAQRAVGLGIDPA